MEEGGEADSAKAALPLLNLRTRGDLAALINSVEVKQEVLDQMEQEEPMDYEGQ